MSDSPQHQEPQHQEPQHPEPPASDAGLASRPADDDYLWDPRATPTPEVVRLEALLRPARYRAAPLAAADAAPAPRARRWRPLAAAGVLLAVGGAWGVSRLTAAPWAVTALAGRPAVGAVPVAGATRLTTGAALSTDAVSAARVNVGRIGRADVGPGSRLRLVRAAGTEHRLALERGTLHARIWAPPRFFLVETPSALAVDLGCVYALSVAADGSGLLRVESGQVELVAGARRALVPAGNAATLRPGRGPGLPFPTAGPPELRAAVAAYEAAEGGGGVGADAPLDALLDASGREATITLWHLLPRVGPGERGRVHARLAALAPPPAGVTEDAVLRLDARALARWRDALEPSWTTETVPAWKRAWRRLWTAFVAAG